MIEIRHLKLIEAINRLGSLKKAAGELFLTQSALSHQLKQLETTVGSPLFHRINNQLHFTPFGQQFYDSSLSILEKMDDLEESIAEHQRQQAYDYIHGYSNEESQRLYDQANSIADFLHWDSKWASGTTILEAGCGVGAQTKIIAQQNPDCQFTCVDISKKSLNKAKALAKSEGLLNTKFLYEDLTQLSFKAASFDHVFVCFVLEHLPNPQQILQELRRVLKPNGTITVIEGDHGSTYFHPESEKARRVIEAQVVLQRQKGGDADIGRRLFPILQKANFSEIQVTPRQIYVDDAKPQLVEGFTLNTFTAMIKGVKNEAISEQLMTADEFDAGIRALEKTASGGGTFCYTFFKGRAKKSAR
ncbi:MAG: methyltransferase domain-containing protein [Bacteroidota bacterium]